MKENTKGCVFYTDNQLNLKIAHKVQKRLKEMQLPITSVSLKPMPHFGNNTHIKAKRGREAYFEQILTALENCKEEIVYFCEHDVLYNKTHFDFTPVDNKFYFNTNVWKVRWEDGHAVKVDDCKQISGMVCRREVALEYYRNINPKHYEPQKNRVSFQSKEPIYDIRHNNNFTKNRWSKDQFKNNKFTKGWKEANIKIC